MLRLPVIVVLVVSMFAGRVCPTQQKEEHEKSKVNAVGNLQNATNTSTNTSNKAVEPSIKATEDIKVNDNKISTTSKSPTNVNPTTPSSVQKTAENENQNCTSTKEEIDMINCHVMPHDDDDDIIEKTVSLNTTEPTVTTTSASNKTETSAESQVPETSHEGKENVTKKDMETVVNNTMSSDQVSYDVVTTEPDNSISINNTDTSTTDSKHTNSSDVSIDPALPALVNKTSANAGSESIVPTIKSTDQVNKKRMPSGIIALVTAISFAVAVALVYIGMIVWRRYIEYRYGHRELLVNELEFDTNDLRHFEL
ncbi:hypothetical protein ANTPLA_LOCUS500 [Anthophora plagiata]